MERVPAPTAKTPWRKCRIGFQPVSLNHRTNGRTIENPVFRHKYCKQFIDQRGLVPGRDEGIVLWTRRQAGSLSYIAFRSVER
jgi:hypothetical protein